MQEAEKEKYIQQLIPILRANPIFTELSDEQIEQFARRADVVFYEQAKRVIQQGTEDDKFFVAVTGQLRAIDTNYEPPHLLYYHSPMAAPIFGIRALLRGGPRAATVEAVTDSYLAVYNRDDWNWLTAQSSRIVDYFEDLERSFEQQAAMDFPGRQWDEVVIAAVKRHPLVFIANLTWPLLLLIVPVVFFIIAELFGVTFLTTITRNTLLTVLVTVPFIVLSALLTAYYYLDWRNDDFIVTTKRVIHIERILFYGEERREAPLTRVDNVTMKSQGLLDLIFDCDDIEIQTAGIGVIAIDNVPQADKLLAIILQERDRAKSRVAASDVASIRKIVADKVGWQDRLERPVLEVAEAEGRIIRHKHLPTRRLPTIWGLDLDYLVPRVKDSRDIKIGKNIESAVIWRKHYYTLLGYIFFPAVSFLIVSYLLLASILIWSPFASPTGLLIRFGLGLLLLATLVWYAWQYDDWRKDVYIVTETRVIDLEGSPFNIRGEKRREGPFDTIQNVNYVIPNFFFKLLNLGNVVIETASKEGVFTFEKVYNPSSVQDEIFNRWAVFQQRQRERARDATTQQVVKVLGEYHHLSQKR